MSNYSSKTVPIAQRVSIAAYLVLKRRADKRGLKVGHYCKRLLEYDAMRKR